MRHIRFLLAAGAFGLTVLFIAGGDARGQEKKAEVKVEASAEKPDADGNQVVTITLDIEKGWHAYANPVGNEDLDSVQTRVSITGKGEPKVVKIDYPPGKLIVDPAGEFRIYEDKVTIKATVKRAKGDAEPLQITVKYQVASSSRVGLPATVKLEVK